MRRFIFHELGPKPSSLLRQSLRSCQTSRFSPLRSVNLRFREVKRRTKVVGVFPSPQSAENLSLAVMLSVSEGWAARRYLDMEPLHALFHQSTQIA